MDSRNDHIFVADIINQRVDEFTAWGEFVKAFGWDVAPAGVDEQQELRIRAASGQFRLRFEASVTGDLPFDASAQEVEAALNSLPSIATGGGHVAVSGGPGGVAGTTPAVYVIRFAGGWEEVDVEEVDLEAGTTPLAGGSPTDAEVITRANGHGAETSLEACTHECKEGSAGSAAGNIGNPHGLAVGDGSVYTFERVNLRVQKFDSSGDFLWMVGKGVDATDGSDICTSGDIESGDICGAGSSGSGQRQFELASPSRDNIDLGPNGNLFVADDTRVQQIDPNGTFVSEIKYSDIHAQDSSFPASATPISLAVDPVSGDVYLAVEGANGIFRITPAGVLVDVLESAPRQRVRRPQAVEVDSDGNAFAVEFPQISGISQPPRVVEFDASGAVVISYEEGFGEPPEGTQLMALGSNSQGDIYVANANPIPAVSHVEAFGPAPLDSEPPPRVPPEILTQFASSVSSTAAAVKASINPRLWADTRFFVEYGLEPCGVGPCEQQPLSPGELLTDQVVAFPITTPEVHLEGLAPGSEYHFRFVAESSGGGPVFGPDSRFVTRRESVADACASNPVLRPESSRELPDCRAYEMVSPIDKLGSDIAAICQASCFPAALNQSAAGGGRLAYSSYRAFGDAKSAPYSSPYLATRDPETGWATEGIAPILSGPSALDTLYKAFTRELEFGWLWEPTVSGSGTPTLSRRDNSDGSYERVFQEIPEEAPELQGVTPDGRCVVFRAHAALTPNANPDLTQVYEACKDQPLSLVSILPGEAASDKASSVGTPLGFPEGRQTSVFQAISDDGKRVFWSESGTGPGPIYVRIDGVGTTKVSSGAAMFWGASPDGGKAIYEEGGSLYEAVIDGAGASSSTAFASQTLGVAGLGKNLDRIYFVSKADLTGGGPVGGKLNLYLREGASTTFIATLADGDSSSQANPISPFHPNPALRRSRTTPDGSHLVFMSQGELTGFDNADRENGKPTTEVFRYDALADELICVSCNPTGARPASAEVINADKKTGILAAAKIPAYESQLYGSRVISDDGSRVFFESNDQLAFNDTDAKQDVYQWEELGAGPPDGKCEESDASFDPVSGGCIDMISSGDSPTGASFIDASASGDDVFFTTSTSLLGVDPGLIDIYDARVGGGFAEPSPPEPECDDLGKPCQPVVLPPPAPSAPQSGNSGPGNELEKRRKHCRKGTHRMKKHGKVRCVKNHRGKGKKGRAHEKSGRAGR